MRIAQIAPLMESVPPRLYGGTERIVSYLADELVQLGHEVTLFASGDSITNANLVSCAPKALRLDAGVRDVIPYYMLMLDRVRAACRGLRLSSLPHRSVPFSALSLAGGADSNHGPWPAGSARSKPLYIGFSDMPLVSISNAQRRPVPNANFVATIHHGLPKHLYEPIFKPRGGYLAFIGRISPEKRPDRAIKLARTLGIPLRIAAKVDKVGRGLFPGADRAAHQSTRRGVYRRDQ